MLDELLSSLPRSFVESPITSSGALGKFTTFHEKGRIEFDKHGGELTDSSISRWRTGPDQKIVADAHRFFELLPDYVKFWGYE